MRIYPRDERFSDCHLVIIGFTGSGKSYKCVQMAFSPPSGYGKYSKVTSLKYRTVFFDTSNIFFEENYQKILQDWGQYYPKSVIKVHTPDMFAKAWDYGARWIIVSPYPTEPTGSYRRKVLEICRAIRTAQAGEKTKQRWPIYIYFDEISDLVDKVKENPVTFVFKRGRQLNMWGRAISQRPQMVNKILFNESKYKLFFYLTDDEWAGLRTGTYKIKPTVEVMEELYNVQYLYYVYDGHKWIKGKVRA
jgi:hypothetical protein